MFVQLSASLTVSVLIVTFRWLQWTELFQTLSFALRYRDWLKYYMVLPTSGDRNPTVASCWTSQEKKALIRSSWTFTLDSQTFSLISLSLFPVLFPFSWETWRGIFPLFLRDILDIICQGKKKEKSPFHSAIGKSSPAYLWLWCQTYSCRLGYELSIVPKNFPWALMKGWTVKIPSFLKRKHWFWVDCGLQHSITCNFHSPAAPWKWICQT